MKRERQERWTDGGLARARRLTACAAVSVAIGVFVSAPGPAYAQRSWEPVVATVPGGTLIVHGQTSGARLPTMVDPGHFPPPVKAPAPAASDALPQGAWSPLVTGAIPTTRPAPPSAAKNAAASAKAGDVPLPGDGLSPVRPAHGGVVAAAPAQAADEDAAASAESDGERAGSPMLGPLDALPPNATPAQQYCFNTADTAADARFAWQAKKIQEMEAELNKRAEILAEKTEEYKKWLQRRDEFSRKAHEKLVGFYSRMRADAAAEQLATIDEETAAAVVTKLETKVASQIMSEMDPVRAARIATVIAGAAKTPPARKRASKKGAPPPSARNAAEQRERPES